MVISVLFARITHVSLPCCQPPSLWRGEFWELESIDCRCQAAGKAEATVSLKTLYYTLRNKVSLSES